MMYAPVILLTFLIISTDHFLPVGIQHVLRPWPVLCEWAGRLMKAVPSLQVMGPFATWLVEIARPNHAETSGQFD